MVWKNRCGHPHIVAFLGIDIESFPGEISMVSEWISNGTIIEFLKREPHHPVEKYVSQARQWQFHGDSNCCTSCFRLQRAFNTYTRKGCATTTWSGWAISTNFFMDFGNLWLSRRKYLSAATEKQKLLTLDLLTLLTRLCTTLPSDRAPQDGWPRNSLTLTKSLGGRQKMIYLPSPVLPLR